MLLISREGYVGRDIFHETGQTPYQMYEMNEFEVAELSLGFTWQGVVFISFIK